jgi:hypothetical protein
MLWPSVFTAGFTAVPAIAVFKLKVAVFALLSTIAFSPVNWLRSSDDEMREFHLQQTFGLFSPILGTVKHANYCDDVVFDPIEDKPAVEWRWQNPKANVLEPFTFESRFRTGLGKSRQEFEALEGCIQKPLRGFRIIQLNPTRVRN